VACGGTHPSTAGQLGLVKILSVTPARGKMRVAFVAGQRALKDYFKCHEAAHASAEMFSTGVENLCASVSVMQEKLRNAEMELTKLRRAQLLSQAQTMIDGAEVESAMFTASRRDLPEIRSALYRPVINMA